MWSPTTCAEARAAAAAADVAIVLAGYDADDEGEYIGSNTVTAPELLSLFPPLPDDLRGAFAAAVAPGDRGQQYGGDRASLSLRDVDEAIIGRWQHESLDRGRRNRRVRRRLHGVVEAHVPAIMMMWYAGMEGGHALGTSAGGRAQSDWAPAFRHPEVGRTLPSFDRDAVAVTYDRFHGQRLLDHLGVRSRVPARVRPLLHDVRHSVATVDAVGEDEVSLTVQVTKPANGTAGTSSRCMGAAGPARTPARRCWWGSLPYSCRPVRTGRCRCGWLSARLAAWDARKRSKGHPSVRRHRARDRLSCARPFRR